MMESFDDLAIRNFQQYLRIRTIADENPDYEGVELFLKELARELGFSFKRIEAQPRPHLWRPIFLLTLSGTLPKFLQCCFWPSSKVRVCVRQLLNMLFIELPTPNSN